MGYNLTISERMILETLKFSDKNSIQIGEKTSLSIDQVEKVLNSLICKNLVKIDEAYYSLNKLNSPAVLKELNNSLSLISEVNEIINSCVRQKIHHNEDNSFKMKKINMSEREEKILNGLLFNVESFIDSLPCNDNIKDQKIIFWGEGNYADIKNNILNF